MNFSSHSRSKTHNPFIALLLQPVLHNFGALAPVDRSYRITYRPDCQKTRKSNAALLLPHLFPVSPLLRYSYKKMGGGGYPYILAPLPPYIHPSLRPNSPLCKSFRINKVTKSPQKAPISKPLRISHF